MSAPSSSNAAAWSALTTGAAWVARPNAALLALEGDDRVDFLQRLTTNNIKALQAGQAAVTVLTSPTARILHVFTVLVQDERLLLLPAPGEGAALHRALRGQIFFMDKVRVVDLAGAFTRLRVVGPRAGALLAEALALPAPISDGAFVQRGELIALADERYELPGVELLLRGGAEAAAELGARLTAAGAPEFTDPALWEARRIEFGLPAPGAELTSDFNPLEAGLAWACAENKGCYTGQEIIARQITYDKVTRTLVGLRGERLQPGATLLAEGREAGVVAGAAFSPTLGATIALAIVRRPWHAPGSTLVARAADGSESPVAVVALPFVTQPAVTTPEPKTP